ncbi:MAG TPA: D-alanyl-D-alanine carboxypeptidase family protein [Chthoniobacterales bacterium]|jgi:D-alanyl-D-alanine carboxypeptidase (penicillin-binding protein 5/6)|nr:D-alanyl-D-alanine carboxypeptidase family protein [Chthoniobacterales bacterium]
MKRWSRLFSACFAITLALSSFAAEPTNISPDDDNSNAVRPSGVPAHKAKKSSKSASARSDADDSSSATPRPRRARRHAAKPHDSDEDSVPTQAVPGSIPKTSASSVIVINVSNGQVLYEKNADQVRAPASTTKLLTGLIVAESGNLDRPVTVAQVDTLAEPVKLNIKPGEVYQRIDLLRALLVKSPNDVARCLARDNAGSIEAFAEKMNQRAFALGARNSHWVNPNGLPDARQFSTARDLATIARVAYANPMIRSIVCLPQLNFRYANGRTRELENTNKLLKRLPYCNGMKTGYTEAAGKCLIASGTRPGRDIIVVVLGDSHSGVWRDAGALLAWALWNPSAG